MQVRGRYILGILFAFILFAYPICAVPPHENFEEADEDLYSIVSFLDDTLILCEQTLEYSYLSNISINFNGQVSYFYSEENQQLSQQLSKEIDEKLSYSSDIINKIKNKASSYFYLKDFVLILKDLGTYVSDFSKYHRNITANFTTIVDYINGFGNETDVISSFINARSYIADSRNAISKIESNIDELNESFSIEKIRNLIPNLNNLLEDYEYFIDSLIYLVKIQEPILFLYVDKNSLYLDEKLFAYGYFIANNNFIENQKIRLFKNNTLLSENYTDNSGRYELKIPISLDEKPGYFNLSASTFFNNSYIYSKDIAIFINKIPTSITFFSSKINYYLNESIYFYGKINDYKKEPLEKDFSLYFAGYNFTICSDQFGNFSYIFDEELPFGSYFAYASFNPENVYKKSRSKTLKININTPTNLSISLNEHEFLIGEDIEISGELKTKIDFSPLSNKTIKIYLNNKNIGTLKTNRDGAYNFSYETDKLRKGRYTIYSEFISNEAEWRSVTSKIININILPQPAKSKSDGLLIIIFLIVFLTISILLFLYRKNKLLFLSKKEQLKLDKDKQTIQITPKVDISEKSKFNISDFTIDLSKRQKDGFKNSIIKKYQSLLNFLAGFDFNISKGVTHLDVRKQMLKFGFSRKATNVVTKVFEYAKYSPYSLDKKDVAMFNKSVSIILKKIGAI